MIGVTLKQAAAGILDLIYPPRCLICERPGAPVICEACTAAFLPIPGPVCAVCGRPQEGSICRLCTLAEEHGGWGFDAARGAAIYVGPMRHAIHRLKYNGMETLGEPLGAFLANRAVADGLLPDAGEIEAVVAVPMHGARERRRGYNQARLLAGPVAEMLGVPLLGAGAMVRVRKTAAQVDLAPEARRRNLDAAMFVVREPAQIKDRHLLLVDDVFTTGTTVSTCAAALKAAGAASVTVVTLAAGG